MATSSIISKPERVGLRGALLALVVSLLAPSADAAPALAEGGAVEAARVVDGATLLLKDERLLRLVDIDVPARGPRALEAKEALAALIEGQALSVKFAGAATDRQGRVLAELMPASAGCRASSCVAAWRASPAPSTIASASPRC
jgi:endonuclease YncB( thermonuclease family)